MIVRLRPHHLLCILTYAGDGYSPAFIANYNRLTDRIAGGADVGIVEGPDDLCAPILGEANAHCRGASVAGRDRLAARDVGALLAVPIEPGRKLALDARTLQQLRAAFTSGRLRAACEGCQWSDLCSSIAMAGYSYARLACKARPSTAGEPS